MSINPTPTISITPGGGVGVDHDDVIDGLADHVDVLVDSGGLERGEEENKEEEEDALNRLINIGFGGRNDDDIYPVDSDDEEEHHTVGQRLDGSEGFESRPHRAKHQEAASLHVQRRRSRMSPRRRRAMMADEHLIDGVRRSSDGSSPSPSSSPSPARHRVDRGRPRSKSHISASSTASGARHRPVSALTLSGGHAPLKRMGRGEPDDAQDHSSSLDESMYLLDWEKRTPWTTAPLPSSPPPPQPSQRGDTGDDEAIAHWEHVHGPSRYYVRHHTISTEEDSQHEFKQIRSEKHAIDRIVSYVPKYVNAFLNTNGGVLYFGVRDDGVILGVPLNRKQKDDLRLRVDNIVNTLFTPQVDPYLLRLEFVEVMRLKSRYSKKDKSSKKSAKKRIGKHPRGGMVDFEQPRSTLNYIVELHVSRGRAPVYMVHHPRMKFRDPDHYDPDNPGRSTSPNGRGPEHGLREVAYIRREGSVHVMSPSMVADRIAHGRPPTTREVPATVATPRVFIGREAEIDRIHQFVHTHGACGTASILVVLHGLPVVGKSALARKLMAELSAHRYPDPHVVINMKGLRAHYIDLEEAMVGVIRMTHPSLHIPTRAPPAATSSDVGDDGRSSPTHTERGISRELMGMYESCFVGKRCVLLIENVGSMMQVLPLIPSSTRGLLVIVTSRKNLSLEEDVSMLDDGTIEDTLYVRLGALSEEDGARLVQAIAPRVESHQALRLSQLCGNLPLPIKITAHTLRKQPTLSAGTMIARLEHDEERYQLLEKVAPFETALALEGPEIQLRLQHLSIFLGTFDAPAAASIVFPQSPYHIVMDTLGRMVMTGYLEYLEEHGVYVQNDLVRLYLSKKRRSDVLSDAALKRRFLAHYLSLLKRVSEIIARSSRHTSHGPRTGDGDGPPPPHSIMEEKWPHRRHTGQQSIVGDAGASCGVDEARACLALGQRLPIACENERLGWQLLLLDRHNFEACLLFASDIGGSEARNVSIEMFQVMRRLMQHWDDAARSKWGDVLRPLMEDTRLSALNHTGAADSPLPEFGME